jgi:hypothetical protein
VAEKLDGFNGLHGKILFFLSVGGAVRELRVLWMNSRQ